MNRTVEILQNYGTCFKTEMLALREFGCQSVEPMLNPFRYKPEVTGFHGISFLGPVDVFPTNIPIRTSHLLLTEYKRAHHSDYSLPYSCPLLANIRQACLHVIIHDDCAISIISTWPLTVSSARSETDTRMTNSASYSPPVVTTVVMSPVSVVFETLTISLSVQLNFLYPRVQVIFKDIREFSIQIFIQNAI